MAEPAPRARRHPAEVTYERIADHEQRWHDKLDPDELEAIAKVRFALWEISEGRR